MTDINSVTMIGRLTSDPQKEFLPSGTAKTRFSIANNYYVPNKEDQVNFFDVTAFGKLADTCAQYLTKGKQIAIQGQLRQSRWQDKDGSKKSRIEIILDSMQMIGGKNESENMSRNKSSYTENKSKQTPPEFPSFGNDEEVPF